MNDKTRNTRIIANALLKGSAKFVWLKDAAGKPVRVLAESLHQQETVFLAAGNDVTFDSKRHRRNK